VNWSTQIRLLPVEQLTPTTSGAKVMTSSLLW